MSKRSVPIVGRAKPVVVGGCKLPHPLAHAHALKLRAFLPKDIPPSPTGVDYSPPAMAVLTDIEGNDQYGDCVEAEDAHYIAVLTGVAGDLYSYTPEETLAEYGTITGFTPSDPNTDQGTDPIVDMNYRVANGYADGSKDAGWAMGDATSQALTQYALDTFGNAKLWLGLPDGIVQNMPTGSGFIWDVSLGPANPNNGHCIGAVGYTPEGVLVSTWGMIGLVTWAALAAWMVPAVGGGIAHRVNPDWIERATNLSPTGLDLAGLQAAFAATFGTVPTPPPAPPGPPPVAGVTLAQAQEWASEGLAQNWPTAG